MESGIPYGQVFVKNSYIGRTFIKPKQKNRESSVQVKLNALKSAVQGKRIIMIVVGALVTAATVFVWRMFHRNLHNDE